MPWGGQGSADRALDRLDEPINDWAFVRLQCRVPTRVKVLQRCELKGLGARCEVWCRWY